MSPPNIKWNTNMVREAALNFYRKVDFIKNKPGAYAYALKNNILDEVCAHMNMYIKKTPENIKKIALKYITKSDFIQKSRRFYDASKKLGIYDEVCSHMLNKQEYKLIQAYL